MKEPFTGLKITAPASIPFRRSHVTSSSRGSLVRCYGLKASRRLPTQGRRFNFGLGLSTTSHGAPADFGARIVIIRVNSERTPGALLHQGILDGVVPGIFETVLADRMMSEGGLGYILRVRVKFVPSGEVISVVYFVVGPVIQP